MKALSNPALKPLFLQIATEAIQNVRTVQSLNRQKYLNDKFAEASVEPHKCSIQRGMLEAATIGLSTCTEVLNFAMIYAAGKFKRSLDIFEKYPSFANCLKLPEM